MLRRQLAENRFWLFVRGIAAITFGVLAVIWPGPSLLALVILVGVFGFADGVTALLLMLKGDRSRQENDWLLILSAVTGIGVGIITLFWPAITAVSLLVVFAAWCIVRGILEGIAAVRMPAHSKGKALLAVVGALSVVIGIWLIVQPAVGLLALIWLAAIYAIVLGILYIAMGIQFSKLRSKPLSPAHA